MFRGLIHTATASPHVSTWQFVSYCNKNATWKGLMRVDQGRMMQHLFFPFCLMTVKPKAYKRTPHSNLSMIFNLALVEAQYSTTGSHTLTTHGWRYLSSYPCLECQKQQLFLKRIAKENPFVHASQELAIRLSIITTIVEKKNKWKMIYSQE